MIVAVTNYSSLLDTACTCTPMKVTYMLDGSFQHEDFCGHRGTINKGDLQVLKSCMHQSCMYVVTQLCCQGLPHVLYTIVLVIIMDCQEVATGVIGSFFSLVQWMTAGRGIVHAEMPASDGENVGLQLWINLKAKNKVCEINNMSNYNLM